MSGSGFLRRASAVTKWTIGSYTEVRANAALTGSYVGSEAIDIKDAEHISIILLLTTGATGAIDSWLPQLQVAISWTDSGNDWAYLNTQDVRQGGTIYTSRGIWSPNSGNPYTVASTEYNDVVASFANAGGWRRLRIYIRESESPTNPASAQVLAAERS